MTFLTILIIALFSFALGYAVWVYAAWRHYGRPRHPSLAAVDLPLDRFMPDYDVVERHHITIDAPAAVAFEAACNMDLSRHPVVRAIVGARQLLLRATPDATPRPKGLLAYTHSIGWGDLALIPGREIVLGAVTRPWEANVTFLPLAPDIFRAFNEPGYVKIAWTLRADTRHDGHCEFWTETRAVATDAVSRRRFRWYWARVSAGIALIRRAMLGPLRLLAERDAVVTAARMSWLRDRFVPKTPQRHA